jgi:iron complex outermembrane receptor protein
MRILSKGVLLATASLLLTEAALAQSGSPTAVSGAATDEQSDLRIEDIVVTAQRRGENLQKVPISITAVTAEKLQATGVTGMQDINLITPSLNLQISAGNLNPTLRGVGAAAGAGSENSVTTYIDGVYLASAAGSLFSLNNIERIEVLKGPQGTLFGRNSTGGVIQIITRDPSSTPQVEANLGYSNYATLEGNFYGTTGLANDLAADLAVHYKTQGEGWGVNLADGKDVNKAPRDLTIRSKMVYSGEDLKIVLAGDYSNIKADTFLSFRTIPGSVPLAGPPIPASAGFYDINTDGGHSRTSKIWGVSLKVEQDLAAAKLLSISSYRESKVHAQIDADGTAVLGVNVFPNDDETQMSQEFQLLSPDNSRIKWIAGLYYFHNEARLAPIDTVVGSPITGAPGTIFLHNTARQTVSSLASFGQVTLPVNESTNLTGGLRYTYDWRTADNTNQTFLLFAPELDGPPVVFPKRRDKGGKLTWRLAVDHSIGNDVLVYASYNRGFRSGVFSITETTGPALRPEIVDAYEIGTKIDALDRHLRVNLAGFLTDSSNLQLTAHRSGAITFFNAAAARAYGAEVEITAIPVNGLTLNGSFGWVHSEYTDFPNAPGTQPNRDPTTGALTGGSTSIIIPNAKGNATGRTPKFTGSVSATYETDLANGRLSLTGTYYRSSGWYPEVDLRLKQKAYGLLSSQLSWLAPGERYRITLWGRNLTKTKYSTFITEQSQFDAYSAAEPRTYGVSVGFKF